MLYFPPVCFISLSIMSSGFVHVVAHGRLSFCIKAESRMVVIWGWGRETEGISQRYQVSIIQDDYVSEIDYQHSVYSH